MGYGKRPGGGGHTIRTFWPDDTATEFWLSADDDTITLAKIIELCREKWPDTSRDMVSKADIAITSEYIHTDCLGYDRYDPGDYTRFLKITKKD